jgi:hypothetical protein
MFASMILATMLVGQAEPSPIWRENTTVNDEIDLYLVRLQYCDGRNCHPEVVLGGYDYDRNLYYPYDSMNSRWLASAPIPKIAPKLPVDSRRIVPKPLAPPAPKIEPRPAPAPARKPTGVIASETIPTGHPYTVNGVAFSAIEATALLNDDSSLPFLTVIADKAEWRKILDTLPAELKAGSRLKCMPPDFWAAQKFRVPVGSTGVFYQKPDGTKIAAQSPYESGKFLAQLDKALPKPAPETPEPPLAPKPTTRSDAPSWLYAVVSLICLLLARNS